MSWKVSGGAYATLASIAILHMLLQVLRRLNTFTDVAHARVDINRHRI